jgi:hypothetical protein
MTVDSRPRRRRSAAPGELSPLDAALTPESRALAETLRDVFTMLQTSVGDFAADCHRDKGAGSRYLSGKRLPPREFIDLLLTEAIRARGEIGISAAMEDNLRELHIRALEAHDPHAAKIQALEDALRLHTTRKKDLEAELAERTREVNELRRQPWTTEVDQERESLQAVKELERQLKEATDERRKAEKLLLMERIAATTPSTPQQNIGILGCIL